MNKNMKICVKSQYAANVILGVYGSTSFYKGIGKKGIIKEGFDKEVFDKRNRGLEEWRNNRAELYSLVNKIQARWNKKKLSKFVKSLFANGNMELLENFFEAKTNFNGNNYQSVKEAVKDVVNKTGKISHAQNTRVSKILHILAPDLIPMMDPKQGEFILGEGNYNKTNRNHLIEAFKKNHEAFCDKKNKKKIREISKQLKEHKIEITITKLRIFELLIWLQTQYKIKKIEVELVRRCV